jgi:hypothetical protein
MVHNDHKCYQAAAVRLDEAIEREHQAQLVRARHAEIETRAAEPAAIRPVEAAETEVLRPSISRNEPAPPGDKPSQADRNQRMIQMDESLSEARRLMIRTCIEGNCEHANQAGDDTMTCVGTCHRKLHGIRCAQLSKGHAQLAVFECSDCMLRKVTGHEPPYTEKAQKNAEETMILKLSRGAEKTGAGYSDLVALEAEWALDQGGQGVRLPTDCEASLEMFLTWLVREKGRSSSLPSLWRLIGSYQVKTFRPNLTLTSGAVKAHYSSLLDEHGVESHPRTSATPRMLKHCIHGGVVDKHCPKPFIAARTKLDIGLEAGSGLRVGEALSSNDFHGLKANHLRILTRLEDGLETVEGMLEHSKTKHKRWTACLGTTLGFAELPTARLLRDYWREAGHRAHSYEEGGYRIEAIDYSVVRVSLLGMQKSQLTQLGDMLRRSKVASVRKAAAANMARAEKRYEATISKDKRYINVHGGQSNDSSIADLVYELTGAGLGSFVSIAEGPLMRSTDGAAISHMAIDPSSTYSSLHKIMDEAYELSNPEGDPDPWLDLQGLESPLWGHHSWRRLADTLARATMAKSGSSEQDIDLTFGWRENMYSQVMQYHYETRFNRERRYRVTMYL